MAEAAAGREGNTATRRQSFRKTLADAGLPQEYLDALEQKRKQLDDSIHKYIAAKERDYKAFEKELRQHYKFEQDRGGSSGKLRKTTTSEPAIASTSPTHRVHDQHQNALDALINAGLRRNQLGQSVAVAVVEDNGAGTTLEARPNLAGLVDRRASVERDKDFVGVFTPAFLPALANKNDDESHDRELPERGDSAPLLRNASPHAPEPNGVQRANSDSMQAKNKRPVELQMPHRTSSSGSSTDGRLTSVLKSPTHPARPHRKRVSLAIGDFVVKPSDNVPSSMTSNNSTPSHSRTRSPTNGSDDALVAQAVESLNAVRRQARDSVMASSSSSGLSNSWTASPTDSPSIDGKLAQSNGKTAESTKVISPASTPPSIPSAAATKKSSIDADGDLFDLHDEDDDLPAPTDRSADDSMDSEDDITGRVQRGPAGSEDEIYDDDAGLVPDHDSKDHAEHVEFRPGSVSFSKQPTNPGFRRPSVSLDPVYRGQDYAQAEHNSVTNEIYGSSYNRPNKGSFTPGSVGESFMARNAELIRNQATQEQVRS
ncbi:hypothetical protein CLAFUW4_05868 [Fulvia fulva]|uniref:Uncharacterized protein n=1 Tax=Passalora fulva TaxID=5499 RepID=A0A9Q8P8H4_PASFU|nr:uncharacterized protein CLAFUR5_06012 [Fulvia fulva]KAK4623608.1 hypothetical protein CLAFUR4_05862 [Fulvia fulva]KAK4624821.1 hypothetical protein CLAFUR0_05875 [Fulvia fulva]UJO17235.1 hypothetical protein CLAFUR5_06012 [Fulvia fulva]WPV14782.1 hypothetical protein CLAFUW4_05868 [Fulvia fulva]WPV30380.1 hypothetical protein CLAFUW7_05866 [Fulvia fulva]